MRNARLEERFFDRSGMHLLVSTHVHRDATGSGIEVFCIRVFRIEVFCIDCDAGTARAARLGRIAAPRGVQHVVVGR